MVKFFIKWEILTLIVVIFANYWIWRILANNFVLALLLITLSIALFILTRIKKLNRTYVFIFLIIFMLTILISLASGFDKTIFQETEQEKLFLSRRHGYLSLSLGKLFTNRVSLYFYKNVSLPAGKLQRNLFLSLDANLYFFASHPRERAGIEEFKKYSPILFPFFLIGFILTISKQSRIILSYFVGATILSGLLAPGNILGPVLFFPLISLLITWGFIYFLSKLPKWQLNL